MHQVLYNIASVTNSHTDAKGHCEPGIAPASFRLPDGHPTNWSSSKEDVDMLHPARVRHEVALLL